ERVLGARVIFGAELVAPGQVRVTVYADPVLIGSPDPSDTRRQAAAARWAAELSAAGIPARLTGALVAELWSKVLYNAALNPRGAAHGVPTPVNATLARLIRARTRAGCGREDSRWST